MATGGGQQPTFRTARGAPPPAVLNCTTNRAPRRSTSEPELTSDRGSPGLLRCTGPFPIPAIHPRGGVGASLPSGPQRCTRGTPQHATGDEGHLRRLQLVVGGVHHKDGLQWLLEDLGRHALLARKILKERGPGPELSLRGGRGSEGGSEGGGAVGGGGDPPPAGDPELLEAPKKFVGLN